MISAMFELLKEIGAFVGLLTGVFVFYDRYARGRPVASLSFEKETQRTRVILRVSNAGPYDAAILGVSCSPDIYRLAADTETKSILRAVMGEPLFFTLRPNESYSLHLVSRVENGVPLEIRPRRVSFRISWRRANSTWLWQLPVFVHADTGFIRKFGFDSSNS